MRTYVVALSLAVVCSSPAARAAETSGTSDSARGGTTLSPLDVRIMSRVDYLAFHPDQQNRHLGVQALAAGRDEAARTYFQRAARYADKLSQAALAELWWEGRGGPRDRAMGYIWMDLAAERGTPHLLAKREYYWAQLETAERDRVQREGPAQFALYGDPAAKPRLEAGLRRGLAQTTGSRTGQAGTLEVCIDTDASGACLDWAQGHQYYADRHWQPRAYWQAQDEALRMAGDVERRATPASTRP
jgi:TPR repeat protein